MPVVADAKCKRFTRRKYQKPMTVGLWQVKLNIPVNDIRQLPLMLTTRAIQICSKNAHQRASTCYYVIKTVVSVKTESQFILHIKQVKRVKSNMRMYVNKNTTSSTENTINGIKHSKTV